MRTTFFIFAMLGAMGCSGAGTPASKPAEQTPTATEPGPSQGAEEKTPEPTTCPEAPAGKVAEVSVKDLKTVIDGDAEVVLVDVREPNETAEGIIEGALLYPWSSGELEARHKELPTDRPIYVICRTGSRSSQATAFLAKKGRACIHNVEGGMNAWLAAKYPTVKK